MKTYWGNWSIAPRILNLSTKWRRVVSFTPRPLYSLEKSPWCPLDRRLGGPKSRSGRGGEEKISHYCPCRELNPCRQAHTLVSILSQLTQVLLFKVQTVCGNQWNEPTYNLNSFSLTFIQPFIWSFQYGDNSVLLILVDIGSRGTNTAQHHKGPWQSTRYAYSVLKLRHFSK
jgi:hypothetical protein